MDVGHAVRGANFLRLAESTNSMVSPRKVTCHLIDWHCGSLKNVTRSTFTSELQAAIMSTDHGLALQFTLHEIRCGPTTPRQGMEIREKRWITDQAHCSG